MKKKYDFSCYNWVICRNGQSLREALKKVLLLRPSSLMAVEKNVGKKGSKKCSFFLNGPALYPPPLLMARPGHFFAASLTAYAYVMALKSRSDFGARSLFDDPH